MQGQQWDFSKKHPQNKTLVVLKNIYRYWQLLHAMDLMEKIKSHQQFTHKCDPFQELELFSF